MMKRGHLQSNFAFWLMALEFKFRDWLKPPIKILKDAGVKPGMSVLDFGCGPGSFSLASARLVGAQGLVYAVDIHPLALKLVQRSARKQGFNNLRTLLGDRLCEVPEGSIDLVLLYDVLHELSEPGLILAELHRVLKPEGLLSVSDHHMEETRVRAIVTGTGFFQPAGNNRGIFLSKSSQTLIDREGEICLSDV